MLLSWTSVIRNPNVQASGSIRSQEEGMIGFRDMTERMNLRALPVT